MFGANVLTMADAMIHKTANGAMTTKSANLYRLIVVVVLALMDDGDHQIVDVKLELPLRRVAQNRPSRGRSMLWPATW